MCTGFCMACLVVQRGQNPSCRNSFTIYKLNFLDSKTFYPNIRGLIQKWKWLIFTFWLSIREKHLPPLPTCWSILVAKPTNMWYISWLIIHWKEKSGSFHSTHNFDFFFKIYATWCNFGENFMILRIPESDMKTCCTETYTMMHTH